jgi:acyl-[acyl-carrier-protein]-phospholipid O-acyltransferase / long-chain-fatty-acid--[acyl-carrier-protein] ligase
MAADTYRETLRHRGLPAFLWTQFLGAFNDNVFKIIVSFYAIEAYGQVRGMSLAAAIFVLPFLVFSGWAGHLGDAFSKRTVLMATKVLEIAAMALAVVALVLGSLPLELTVLFLMAAQSTFFSPAKYGIVPEIVSTTDISRANGLLEMSTFAAIILGTTAGGQLFEFWHDQPWRLGLVLVVIAVAGTITSLGIPRVGAANPGQRFAWNPFAEIGRGLSRLLPDRTLWMTTVGISYFWFLGALLQQVLLPWGQQAFGVGEGAAARLYTSLAAGIGMGSLVAGRLSGRKIELGLVPLGSIGLGVLSLLLVTTVPFYWLASLTLFGLGFFGGFFAVPLNALLQQRPAAGEKGRVLATNNFLNTIGMLLSAAVFFTLGDLLHLTLGQIIVIAGLFTLVASVYALATLPDFFVRFTLWMLTHTIYRIRILGTPNIPERGPALLVCNHVSMVDGALVGACVQRFVRFLVYGPYFRRPLVHGLLGRLHAIPVTAGSKREVLAAIERARAELQAGHVVCIFAEGAISRTGNLLPFKRGFERMVEGLDVPIVPVYLDRVWGSVFSFKRERFLWTLPERLPYPVTVSFGDPLPSGATASEVRMAIMDLGANAFGHRRPASDLLQTSFMKVARRRWGRPAMADSTGQELTYGRALVGSIVLGRVIERRTRGEEMVGVLLPSSVGGAVANIAVLAAGRVPVNLNFTIGREAMDAAIGQASIRTIITSRRFLAKASLTELPGMVFLEDLRKDLGGLAKLTGFVEARFLPFGMLAQRYGGRGHNADSLATVIFSSGSTGLPKGVMITHRNILANADSLAQIFPMSRDDCFIGVLPFFHSFGLTGTLWFPLLQGCRVAYHPNPMDARAIGELAAKYRGSMLISTPTFSAAYLRRCTKEQFAHLRYAIVGAEKLREPIARAFRERFGVDLLEGYGCTEMAPVVSVNRPDVAHGKEVQVGRKAGSVGHPVPGVAAKVVDRETGEGPLIGREGLLLVRGPNMMQGYLNQAERTAEVIRDGWYVTGDIATVDEDGFIHITDRLSRFSKIGGEMVPHLKLEEAINEILGEVCSAVTAVPDPTRGERLVAFHTRLDTAADVLWERLCQTELPRLWLPRRENLFHLEVIPTLGTGKVDLKRLRELALERAGVAAG